MSMWVTCPKCGHKFRVPAVIRQEPRGQGAWYAYKIKKLGRIHVEILRLLEEENRPLTKRQIQGLLVRRGIKVGGYTISGRLSELLGLGYVGMERTKVKLWDEETQTWKWVKKPVWWITELGKSALHTYVKEGMAK